MSSAKERILGKLRAAGKQPVQEISSRWQAPRYQSDERLERFKSELTAAHAEVIETTEILVEVRRAETCANENAGIGLCGRMFGQRSTGIG